MELPWVTYDANGTPAVWAHDAAGAYYGIGFLHGLHRPAQTLLVHTAGRGRLAAELAPRGDLVALDALAHRLDIPRRAEAEVARLTERARLWLQAYVDGCVAGLERAGRPFELRLLAIRLAPPSPAGVLGGMMLAAYLGLAEGQERMERALVEALAAGADPAVLSWMFSPHLDGWDPVQARGVERRRLLGFAGHGLVGSPSGSNAWAVTGARSASGRPLLCGDPHLPVNQLPAVLFEVRARVGDEYWLGATIPGIPGIAVGRNRRVAWAGTFAVADNVDFTIEEVERGGARRSQGHWAAVVEREVEIRRRWRRPLRLRFFGTDRGTLETDRLKPGRYLAARWAGAERSSEALEAYMALPLAESAAAAERTLVAAHTFSLHYVLADRDGDVRYCQAGRIPHRAGGWSGLWPASGDGAARWVGFYEGAELPRASAQDGIVASANEGRPAADGSPLATLPQPRYRLARIGEQLAQSRTHDAASMGVLQLDVFSLQAAVLRPRLSAAMPPGRLREVLDGWDGCYDVASRGAHAFEIAYHAARRALAPELGGEWLTAMLDESEIGVWWCEAFDRVLQSEGSWTGERGARLARALAQVARRESAPWGEVQRFTQRHLVLGGVPWTGLDRGPHPLPGSRATIRQGAPTRTAGREVVTAPAYRFVCDLAEDGARTSLAGGIDGARASGSYDRWLAEWLAGAYHRLEPPSSAERRLV